MEPPSADEPGTSLELLEEKRCRRRAKNRAKKEDSKRAREEEIRRRLYEPKNRRGVRLVGAGEAETLRGGHAVPGPLPLPVAPVSSEDFPDLGSGRQQHRRRIGVETDGPPGDLAEPERHGKPRRAHPIMIDLMSALKRPAPVAVPRRRSPARIHGGNQLDSSNPERRKGKTRENPRPQKPSHLKAVILTDRKARKAARAQLAASLEASWQELTNKEEAGCVVVVSCAEEGVVGTRETGGLVASVTPRDEGIVDGEENTADPVACIVVPKEEDIVDSTEKTGGPVACAMPKVEVVPRDDGIVDRREKTVGNKSLVVCVVSGEEGIVDRREKTGEPVACILSKDKGIEGRREKTGGTIACAMPIVEAIVHTVGGKEGAGGLVGRMGALELDRPPPLIHTRRFRDYCDHAQSPELDAAVTALITDIVKFQDRAYFSDPIRAHAKRRFVLGFRETGKYLGLKKLKLLVIAPDLETAKSKGGIEDTVTRLREEARGQGVPCAFSVGRATLRRLTNKSCVVKGISCVGVINYEGSQDNFHAIREMLPSLAERYRAMVAPPPPEGPDVNERVVATFLGKLAKELG